MEQDVIETIVIGAGPAGLSASYYLQRLGIKHIVFERGRIAESWRSQRWDSFRMNTANKINTLPGDDFTGDIPEAFSTGNYFASYLDRYVSKNNLPVEESVEVVAVDKSTDRLSFTVTISKNGVFRNYTARQVVICSGGHNEAIIPSFAKNLSPGISQLHAGEYRNAAQLPPGAVLVAGSAQSGCQIAEDLLTAGRKVFLSTSLVSRLPRRYRGKDCLDWLLMMGFFNLKTSDVSNPEIFTMKPPQLTGTGNGNRTMSLQYLGRKGAVILGRMKHAEEGRCFFDDNAHAHVKFADEFSNKAKAMIDVFITQNALNAPPPEEDPDDSSAADTGWISTANSLELKDNHIRSIIWSTGFTGNYRYIRLPVLDYKGNPQHTNGITAIEGLYFLGLPWLRSRKSSLVTGIRDDAAFIADRVNNYSRQQTVSNTY